MLQKSLVKRARACIASRLVAAAAAESVAANA